MTRILGVDPGSSGALALLTTLGELIVHDMPVCEVERGGKTKREIDTAQLAAIIAEMQPTHAVIERVGAMPGQGVTSMFAFGRSVGQVEGILAALKVPTSRVAPQVWRGYAGVRGGKDASRLRASELLPAYAANWRLAKHDGRAEASLISLYGVMHLPEMFPTMNSGSSK